MKSLLFFVFFAETFPLTAEPGWLSILPTRLSAQSGGVQPVFRHVQLRRAAVSFVSCQLRTPCTRSSLRSGPCPSAKQGLGPGGRLCPVALWTLSTQRPHQVERGGSLRVHPLAARSRPFYLTGAKREPDICVTFCAGILFLLYSCSLHAGCQEIADEFRSQEIDGQALLLLKEDHLMSTMNIKLGPALKIFARINMLKDS